MSQADILHIASQSMFVAFKLAAPVLIVSLVIGVFLSLVQAVTQVQEMTLTFVPKLAGIAVTLVVSGSWMLREITSFTRNLFESIPSLVGS